MTRKEEIQEQIEKLQAELEDIDGVEYLLSGAGFILETDQQTEKNLYIKQGNSFPTKEAAERERDRRALIKELRDRAGGYKPVWDGKTRNYCISWTASNGWIFGHWSNCDDCPRSGYFKEPIEGLIEEFGARLNLLRDV